MSSRNSWGDEGEWWCPRFCLIFRACCSRYPQGQQRGRGGRRELLAAGSAVPGAAPSPGGRRSPAGLSPAPAAGGSARTPGVASPGQATRNDPEKGFAAV